MGFYEPLKKSTSRIQVNVRHHKDEKGFYDHISRTIGIYASEHPSIHEVSKSIIHEAFHAKYGKGTFKEDIQCRIEEAKHEIRKKLTWFEKRIFSMSISEAFDIKEQLDAFVSQNNVTPEQMQEFAESGAGEELYMLTC